MEITLIILTVIVVVLGIISAVIKFYPTDNTRGEIATAQTRPSLSQTPANFVAASETLTTNLPQAAGRRATTLLGRYTDAYLVAKLTIGIGSTIKAVGFILATLIFLGAALFGNFASGQRGIGSDVSGGVFYVSLFIGGISAVITYSIFYVIGVIVSSNGQVLKATLDNAVGNSPFLTDDLKAKIMSLPEA